MDVHISWVGVSNDYPGRFWGFFEDPEQHDRYIYNLRQYYYTFWGKQGGKIFFARTISDKAFKANCWEKRRKYSEYKDRAFNKMIADEFGQYRLFKKLKDGY